MTILGHAGRIAASIAGRRDAPISIATTVEDPAWLPAEGPENGAPPAPAPLRFQIGARTLASVPRRLRRVGLSLDQVLAGQAPPLNPLGPGEDGILLTSWPAAAPVPTGGLLVHVRQRYRRYWIDLAAGETAWRAGLSANARAQIGRKARKLGPHQVRRYCTSEEIARFHAAARTLSAKTYQERLLGRGLPADPAALRRLAAADAVRAWLLFVEDQPVAYLCCGAAGDTLRYDHVGHDPEWNDRSPGAVLQAAALADLFADRFARFDFTEGEGQHKRQLATGSVACVDLLLLRPTPVNRLLVAALRVFDLGVEAGKRWAPGLKRFRR